MNVIKRDGRVSLFNKSKILVAVKKASDDVSSKDSLADDELIDVVNIVSARLLELHVDVSVEQIHDMVEIVLKEREDFVVAMAYANFRKERTRVRELKTDLMKAIDRIGVETDRDNANVGNNFSSKLLRIHQSLINGTT